MPVEMVWASKSLDQTALIWIDECNDRNGDNHRCSLVDSADNKITFMGVKSYYVFCMSSGATSWQVKRNKK